jgi:hypothetical protein
MSRELTIKAHPEKKMTRLTLHRCIQSSKVPISQSPRAQNHSGTRQNPPADIISSAPIQTRRRQSQRQEHHQNELHAFPIPRLTLSAPVQTPDRNNGLPPPPPIALNRPPPPIPPPTQHHPPIPHPPILAIIAPNDKQWSSAPEVGECRCGYRSNAGGRCFWRCEAA